MHTILCARRDSLLVEVAWSQYSINKKQITRTDGEKAYFGVGQLVGDNTEWVNTS